ncbi:MAG TPA: hypothetical protein VK206_21300 [Anaerolineales bacterium]|nr:hypothetical protein [Anaerolineales bacterium]
MLQTNYHNDPIVEILRLAYRRGLAIQREQEEKNKAVNLQAVEHDVLTIDQKDADTGTEAKEGQA